MNSDLLTSPAFLQARFFSEEKIRVIREHLGSLVPSNCTIVLCGSYARREAHNDSDIDYFFVGTDKEISQPRPTWMHEAHRRISTVVEKSSDLGSAFDIHESHAHMVANIGGDLDDNRSLTRRVTFLLEGECLVGDDTFKVLRRELLEKYLLSQNQHRQMPLFLFNDIARYWRTLGVDLPSKVRWSGRPYGTWRIKFAFSRKLIYASGLFTVGSATHQTAVSKIDFLEEMFSIPPLQRLISICGTSSSARMVRTYEVFVKNLTDSSIRRHLDSLSHEAAKTDATFNNLKDEGERFTHELLRLFHEKFNSIHPIYQAVIF